MKKVDLKKKDKIAYDPHMLDGIDYVDMGSAIMFLKSMIPGDMYTRLAPYSSVRRLIKFFDKDDGILRHGRSGSADLIKYLYSRGDVRHALSSLTLKNSELMDLLYTKHTCVGYELIQQISWKVSGIVEDVQKLVVAIEKSEVKNLFGNTEAVNGADDGRLIGLRELLLRASKALDEIIQQTKRLEKIVKKGKDPMSYACMPAYRMH